MSLTYRIRDTLYDLNRPLVMGIVNLTPDSFYGPSRQQNQKNIYQTIEGFITDGADWIDIGAMSSRPGAKPISLEDETKRLQVLDNSLTTRYPDVRFSIDTYRSEVAKYALDLGMHMINDISGGRDPDMYALAVRYQVPYVMMHLPDWPETMQDNIAYDDVTDDVMTYFIQRIQRAHNVGLKDIIIDPGFGFGKTLAQNFELLRNLDTFHIFEYPILVGISRKSMIRKVVREGAENRLIGTSVLHWAALESGALILRVHDVAEAKDVIALWSEYKTAGQHSE